MPLNPPTYRSMDVYYSNNVFVNKVPVALWKPPAGAFNDGSPGTKASAAGGRTYDANESGNKAYDRDIAAIQGTEGLENETAGSNEDTVVNSPVAAYAPTNAIGTPGYTGPIGPTPGVVNPNPSAPAPAGSYELTKNNLPNYSPRYPQLSDHLYDMRISKYFNFDSIKKIPEDSRGYSARQIAANWIDVAQNILDPLKGNGFSFTITSGFRSHAWNVSQGRTYLSDHELGIAVDVDPGGTAQNKALFQWIIKSGIPFWQVIWEGGWVHISYNGGQPKPGEKRIMIMPTGKSSGGVFTFGSNIEAAIQKSNSIF